MGKIPIVLCIDVEPDERLVDPTCPTWHGFDECFGLIERFRHQCAEHTETPPHFNWFLRLDPQIERIHGSALWPIYRYRTVFTQIAGKGDELGLHTHAWRWDEQKENWIVDHGNKLWIQHCVERSLDAFEAGFGRRARSFRFGDRWQSNEVFALLEERGIVFDLTVEPGRPEVPAIRSDELATGNLPDYRMVPPVPYRPSRFDFRFPADRNPRDLWVIPVTTAPHDTEGYLSCNLVFARSTIELIIEHALASKHPCVVMVCRSGDLVQSEYAHKFLDNLELLASHRKASQFIFTTPEEALTVLRQNLGNVDAPFEDGPRLSNPNVGQDWVALKELLKAWKPAPVLFDSGFYDDEVGFRWMSSEGSMLVMPHVLPARLNFEMTAGAPEVYDRYPFNVQIDVENGERLSMSFCRESEAHSVEMILAAHPTGARVRLVSSASFVPAERGLSSDCRRLSVCLRALELTPQAAQEAPLSAAQMDSVLEVSGIPDSMQARVLRWLRPK